MEKVFGAQRVAKKLFTTEAAVDSALSEAAELMSEMLKVRKDINVSMGVVDGAAAKLIEAITALGEARTAMVAMHEELAEVKLRIGVRTKMDFEEKYPLLGDKSETVLREVG
jgi:hypothetical protein